jgi:2-phospho-L-lactate/phosphoenolpyruvate guanylyltransferase
MTPDAKWWVVVPMKDTRLAKSRLGGQSGDRRQLAILMARDTLCAIVNAASVEGVLVVCDNPDDVESFELPGVSVLVCDGPGINEAIRAGNAALLAQVGSRNVAVLPGDLPYLRSAELDVALGKAGSLPSACVGDRTGTGTTLLTARAGQLLQPAYGDRSLSAHREAGALELDIPVWSGLRRDVDTPEDLLVNMTLGYRTRQRLERRATPGAPALLEAQGA